jgi:class 3 adenylate cyclase
MNIDFENQKFPRWRIFFQLYLRNIAANIMGFAIIVVLNFFTPMTSSWMGHDMLENGAGQHLVAIFPFILLFIAMLQFQIQGPVCMFLMKKTKGETCYRYTYEQIKRRILNFPLILALIDLAVYIAVPLLLILSSVIFELFYLDTRVMALLFFRSVMIGLITACLSFFIVESYTRRISIPLVFPRGGLTEVPGVFRVNIMRRIRLLHLAGTLTPMLLLVMTLAFVVWDVVGTPSFSRQLIIDIFYFTLVLCIIFIVVGYRLNLLVGRSLREPVDAMLKVVNRVEQGDFTQQITVVSSDELGRLAEAGNRMIQGLAERERVRESFGRYVTPEIRDKILSGEIPLDGERKMATMLFADLRGFSSYVESNSPEEVIMSMREYFTIMEDAVRDNGGLVLQYVGDELEAVFGVPIEVEDHADRAVHAALQMQKGLREFNENRMELGKARFSNGVGICSGPVLAGNTGSKDHPAYGLIGDTVNIASRIQEMTKDFSCDILIARQTRDLLREKFFLRSRGQQPIKGHAATIEIFEVMME